MIIFLIQVRLNLEHVSIETKQKNITHSRFKIKQHLVAVLQCQHLGQFVTTMLRDDIQLNANVSN